MPEATPLTRLELLEFVKSGAKVEYSWYEIFDQGSITIKGSVGKYQSELRLELSDYEKAREFQTAMDKAVVAMMRRLLNHVQNPD